MSSSRPNSDQPDERASVESAQERGARIAELFTSHNRELMRFLTCRLRSSQDAKEVAQEAYVRMLQLEAPNGVSYLRAFLFKTASHLAADRLKSAARRGRIDQIDFTDDEECAPSPEGGAAANQELDRVLKIVDRLPAKCRYAFLMNRFYEYELAEVAQFMNLSERMVRLYVERALLFCRRELLKDRGSP